MKLPVLAKDTRQHLGVGLLIFVYLVAVVLLARASPAVAVAVGGTGACGFVELYQRARGNGAAEWSDLIAGASPSWAGAIAWWWIG